MSGQLALKVVFIGCVETSYSALAELVALHQAGVIELVAVVTKAGSNFNTDFSDLTPLCQQVQLKPTYFQGDEDYTSAFSHLEFDLLFCIGWSHIVPQPILNMARLAAIGFHPAKLPQNRGRHPIIWSLALGLKETASSFFIMEASVDAGALLNQQLISIKDSDNARDVYDKVLALIPQQIGQIVKDYRDNTVTLTAQDKTLVNHWRKRTKRDGQIDWRMPATDIFNLIRALSAPYPGATFDYLAQEVKVVAAEKCSTVQPKNIEPGKVLAVDKSKVLVKCGQQSSLWVVLPEDISLSVGDYL